MGLKHFLTTLPERGIQTSWYILKEWAWRNSPIQLYSWGESVYKREWDILVILDACRVDLMASVIDEYEWLPDTVGVTHSIAGSSKEWMQRTFLDDAHADVTNTAYVTGNPFSAQVFSDSHPFARLEEVWRASWDDEYGTILPETMVDHAITVAREHDGPVIVHMMQPHVPFIGAGYLHAGFNPSQWGDPDAIRADDPMPNVWYKLRTGAVDRDAVWAAYQGNLRAALSEVDRLRNNVDGRMVLTSDHGNAMGEFGMFGHGDIAIPPLRNVPWIPLEAVDRRTSAPAIETSRANVDVTDRLEALGYMEAE